MSSKKKTTTTTTLDPVYSAAVYGNQQAANQLRDSYRPYEGSLVAGFNPTQQEAFGLLGDIGRSNIGAGTLGNAVSAAQGAAGYQPINVTPEMIAAANVYAPGRIGAQQIAADQVDPSLLAAANLDPYLNPYRQEVIDAFSSDANRQRDIALSQAKAQALKSGAWGGTGAGVYQAQLSDNYDRNLLSGVANLRSQGFQSAQDAARFDIANRLNADLANQNANLAAAQANQGASLTADQFNADTELRAALANQSAALAAAQANQSAGLTAQQANQSAGLQGAGLRLNAAGVLGDLSNREIEQAARRAGILGMVGDAQQQYEQAVLDAEFKRYQDEMAQRMALQQLASGATGIIPQTGTNTTTQKSSGLGGVVGGLANLGLTFGSGGAFGARGNSQRRPRGRRSDKRRFQLLQRADQRL